MDDLVAALARIVGPGAVLTAGEDMAPFVRDWRGRYRGAARAVVKPATTAEVAEVVKACALARTPLVPQGGNTGLVGGATPGTTGNEIVLSTARMNRIERIDPTGNTATVQAGVVLSQLQEAAAAANRLFPLSLASEGSCTIGGNLSTNAGGTAVLRYGTARELCLAVEAVTARGDVVGSTLTGLRKDNTGYDLRDLFIGSEGTLGIICRAVVKLFALPRARITALAGVASVADALVLLARAQSVCGPGLTAFELISDRALGLVERHFPPHRSPLAARPPYAVLLEISEYDDEARAIERLEGLLASASEAGEVSDAAVAQSLTQSSGLWALRELVSEAQAAQGPNIKHDIAVPIDSLGRFVEETDRTLAQHFKGIEMVTFGHLGDGNLHYNVAAAPGAATLELLARQEEINTHVYDAVARFGGSISAEHGLGQLKRVAITRYKSAAELELMRALKRTLDPDHLLNPGKVL